MVAFDQLVRNFLRQGDVKLSTMMHTPCLRCNGKFVAMIFKKSSLIVKLPKQRVDELIKEGVGEEFNFTGKCFPEWILIPRKNETMFAPLIHESIEYVRKIE